MHDFLQCRQTRKIVTFWIDVFNTSYCLIYMELVFIIVSLCNIITFLVFVVAGDFESARSQPHCLNLVCVNFRDAKLTLPIMEHVKTSTTFNMLHQKPWGLSTWCNKMERITANYFRSISVASQPMNCISIFLGNVATIRKL